MVTRQNLQTNGLIRCFDAVSVSVSNGHKPRYNEGHRLEDYITACKCPWPNEKVIAIWEARNRIANLAKTID
ncbi:unnamed protein product [Blumeria hordei]|uniref:Uncharacterized protein n=1 Tax=Blumeria hordei TaxID=2867405 RepID=A0A383V0J3_BLUHO|nr:unnamed protein product [Blumeria hordei]